jgi:hypothetical protein
MVSERNSVNKSIELTVRSKGTKARSILVESHANDQLIISSGYETYISPPESVSCHFHCVCQG